MPIRELIEKSNPFENEIGCHQHHVADSNGDQEQVERILAHLRPQQHQYNAHIGKYADKAHHLVDVLVRMTVVPAQRPAEQLQKIPLNFLSI